MELLDLYEFDRTKTGATIVRGDLPPYDGRYTVIHICIFDEKGNMLIQKRSSDKKSWPDKWDVSVGGAVISGETSGEAASRELFEELGIMAYLNKTPPALSICSEHCFDDYYVIVGKPVQEELTLQKDEVSEVRLASKAEVFTLLREGEFVPYKEGVIELLFDMVKSYGALK